MPKAVKSVNDILEAKGHQVYSVGPEATVFEALLLMAEKGVGAVVVLEGDNLVGIMSERDYARKVILKGKSSRDTLVRDIMTQKVIRLRPDALIEVCMELMTDMRIRHLPVCDGDKLVGLISIGDVVNAVIAEQRYLIRQLRAYLEYGEP